MKSSIGIRKIFIRNVLNAVLISLLMSAWPCAAATKIRMAQPVIAMMYAPLYYGVHQGIFADEGFELEFMTMRTDLAIAALGTGDVDYIVHGGAALRAAAQGFPLKLIFALDDKTPFWLAARPQIKDVRQLTGKKIGISTFGSATDFALRLALKKWGIKADSEVSILQMRGVPEILPAMASGSLHGGVMSPRWTLSSV